MFMVKEEYANIKNLLRVRLSTQARSFFWLFIVVAVFMVGSGATAIFGVLENIDGFKNFSVADFSVSFFGGVLIGFTIVMFLYRQTNAKLSVFPQTNNSRFISSVIVNYVIAIIGTFAVLVMYLVNLGIINLLTAFRDNIHLALNIDIGFIIAGFFVYLAYIFLIIAVLELVGTILRKWTYYAAIAFIALFSLAVINILRVIEYAPKVLAFLISEPSLPLFFLKAFGLWLVITVAALVINRFTVYGKSPTKASKGVVIACVVIAAVISVVAPAVVLFNRASGGSVSVSEIEAITDPVNTAEFDAIRIDVSHLPRGSRIIISGENLVIPDDNGAISSWNWNTDAVVHGTESLAEIQGDTLIVQFRPPAYIVNGIEILHYTNPQVTAHLDGNTLYIDYTRDSASVVFMPIWGMVRQFDTFKDKGVLSAHSFGFSSGWWGSTNINISVE